MSLLTTSSYVDGHGFRNHQRVLHYLCEHVSCGHQDSTDVEIPFQVCFVRSPDTSISRECLHVRAFHESHVHVGKDTHWTRRPFPGNPDRGTCTCMVSDGNPDFY